MPLGLGCRRPVCRRCSEVRGAFAVKVDAPVSNDRQKQRRAQLGAGEPRGCGGRCGRETMRVFGTMVCVLVLARFSRVLNTVNGRPRVIHGQVHKDSAGNYRPQHRGNEENNRGECTQNDEHAQTLSLGSKYCQASPPASARPAGDPRCQVETVSADERPDGEYKGCTVGSLRGHGERR